MSQEPTTINLSSSACSHANCELDLYRTVVQGYKVKALPIKIVYGVAVHKFIEVMYLTGGHIPTARLEAIKVFRDIPFLPDNKSPHMMDINHMSAVALMTWEFAVKKEIDFEILILNGKPAVEVTFQEEIYNDGEYKFNWCGTIDRIGKKTNGIWLLPDWKTTSAWNPTEHLSQYELKNSPRGYVLALKLMSERYPDSTLAQVYRQGVGARFDGIYLKPKINDVKFISSDVYTFEESELIEFQNMITLLCYKFATSLRNNHFSKTGILNGSCNKKFGKCDFWGVCKQTNPKVMDILLDRDFQKKPFDPLAYND